MDLVKCLPCLVQLTHIPVTRWTFQYLPSLKHKQVRNLYMNYIQREKSIVDKVDLAEKGVAIKVRKGESADQAVERNVQLKEYP